MHANASQLVSALLLIGWKSGATFLSQSCGVKVSNQLLLDTQMKTALRSLLIILKIRNYFTFMTTAVIPTAAAGNNNVFVNFVGVYRRTTWITGTVMGPTGLMFWKWEKLFYSHHNYCSISKEKTSTVLSEIFQKSNPKYLFYLHACSKTAFHCPFYWLLSQSLTLLSKEQKKLRVSQAYIPGLCPKIRRITKKENKNNDDSFYWQEQLS